MLSEKEGNIFSMSHVSWSRMTLATIDAAAIELDALSPLMIGVIIRFSVSILSGMASITRCEIGAI